MLQTLLDTDIISFYLRGEPNVVRCVERYVNEYGHLNLSIISYYEIVSGLKFRDARKQLASFLQFVSYNRILPLTTGACDRAGDTYARCRRQGTPIDDIDLLIAGTALDHDLAVATHNTAHFTRVEDLIVVDWTNAESLA